MQKKRPVGKPEAIVSPKITQFDLAVETALKGTGISRKELETDQEETRKINRMMVQLKPIARKVCMDLGLDVDENMAVRPLPEPTVESVADDKRMLDYIGIAEKYFQLEIFHECATAYLKHDTEAFGEGFHDLTVLILADAKARFKKRWELDEYVFGVLESTFGGLSASFYIEEWDIKTKPNGKIFCYNPEDEKPLFALGQYFHDNMRRARESVKSMDENKS